MTEKFMETAKAYYSINQKERKGSKLVVIPKKIRALIGDPNFFIVKLDERNRIIYEPVRGGD